MSGQDNGARQSKIIVGWYWPTQMLGGTSDRREAVTPQMHEALLELSTFYAPEPGAVFHYIVGLVGRFYPNSMAMLNLIEGDRLLFREVVNPHPAMVGVTSLPLDQTY